MKKTGHIKAFSYTAILIVFTLQGIWLYRTYNITEAKISLEINNDFADAVEKELLYRFRLSENSPLEPKPNATYADSDVLFDSGKNTLSNENTGEDFNLILQEYLISKQKYIALDTLSIIFSRLLSAKNINGLFIINHFNTHSGEILETTSEKSDDSSNSALYSTVIPTRIDKSEGVQAVLISPYRTVFLQMAIILTLSILLILFVAYSMFYQMSSFIKEKKLRQLQTDFSHALTHDMATPLQTIAQINNLLSNEKLYNDPKARAKYIDLAQKQLLNLQALTDRILTVAKAQKSTLDVDRSPVNLMDLIEQLIEKFNIQTKKPIEFLVSFSPENIHLQADATLLYNALSNLIDNAVKYSGSTVKITIICKHINRDVSILIKDNGYGISENDHVKVFSMFERGKAVMRKEASGFGLGLSYVKSVAEAHGGTIQLSSKEGEGSEFELFLPSCILNI